MNYYDNQLAQLQIKENEENYLKIKISSDSNSTNYLSITESQLVQIIDVLKKGE